MLSLILVVLSISLTAATLYASLSYLPGGVGVTSDTRAIVKTGFVALEKAFQAKTTQDGGAISEPTSSEDGGLFAHFSGNYGFLSRVPKGYAWKYGFNGLDHYFCLYPVSGAPLTSELQWKGFNRVRSDLSDQQYFIKQGGVAACDSATPSTPQSADAKAPPATYPALISLVYLVRYSP